MTRAAAWLRYRLCRLVAVERPKVWIDSRYNRTPAGGWRYLREQAAPAEVAWYEGANVPDAGCIGCGNLWPHVCTYPTPGYPLGNTYCWRCVQRVGLHPDEYRIGVR